MPDFGYYEDQYSAYRKECRKRRLTPDSPQKAYTAMYAEFVKAGLLENVHHTWLTLELFWWKSRRPYYNVWPGILQVFENFAVENLPPAILLSENLTTNPVLIRLPRGSGYGKDDAFIVGVMPSAQPSIDVFTCLYEYENSVDKYPGILGVPINQAYDTLSEGANLSHMSPLDPERQQNAIGTPETNILLKMMRVGICCLALQNDESLIEPDFLQKDESKLNRASAEEKERLAEKAWNRRDQIGFHIGRKIEVIPHFRRPHPALFWTGPGGKIPKVQMRAGAIIHRRTIGDMPSGYMST